MWSWFCFCCAMAWGLIWRLLIAGAFGLLVAAAFDAPFLGVLIGLGTFYFGAMSYLNRRS